MKINAVRLSFLCIAAVCLFAACDQDADKTTVWRWSKSVQYTVTDGVATYNYEYAPNWISYDGETKCSYEYRYTVPINNTVEGSYSQTGSQEVNGSYTASGTTAQSSYHYVYHYTTSYANPSMSDSEYSSEYTYDTTYIFFDGVSFSQHSVSDSKTTINGVVTPSSSVTSYVNELVGTVDGVKTYKQTSSNGSYTLSKIKGGVVLEQESYDTAGELTSTTTYTLPDNEVIRKKLPTFTLYSTNYSYQRCEVLSDSGAVLGVRVKTYRTDDDRLTGQYDQYYEKYEF